VERLAPERGAASTFHARVDEPLGSGDRLCVVVSGEDRYGWTLDDYVIPRLGSGCYGCQEIDLSHPAMRAIPLRREPGCGHDGWQAGCEACASEEALAVSLIDGSGYATTDPKHPGYVDLVADWDAS
jgi:hypothetical protein